MGVASSPLTHDLLTSAGLAGHGFGTRTSNSPLGLLRPTQVHGTRVASVLDGAHLDRPRLDPEEADAVISGLPGLFVAVVTADCVPVLACSRDGRAVAAIHAGWRGLAQGVVRSGLDALAKVSGNEPIHAVVGPHIGVCCYEVDAPVESALRERFPQEIARALRPSRPGHHFLDLGALVRADLESAGVSADRMGRVGACTRCHQESFHSFRRDREAAGRMTHFIAAAP